MSFATQQDAQFLFTIFRRDRVVTASRIYHQISTFFPELSQKQFDFKA